MSEARYIWVSKEFHKALIKTICKQVYRSRGKGRLKRAKWVLK